MEKTIIEHDRIDSLECSVHRLPMGLGKVHESYGLRIVSFGRGGKSPPGQPFPRYFEFYCLSHMFEGRGFYWTPKGGKLSFEAGSGVMVVPRLVHCYGGDGFFYQEDTICFWGPVADCLYESGLFRPGVAKFGPERRLLPIIERAMDPSAESQIVANVELQRLLLGLHLENRPPEGGPGGRGRIESLLDDLRLNPERWWTVGAMAEFCGLGEVQFRRVFHEVAGMSPKHYVETLKMQRAIEMLIGGREPVGEIAKSLSYSDPFHFSRRFKNHTGMSPAEYRRTLAS